MSTEAEYQEGAAGLGLLTSEMEAVDGIGERAFWDRHKASMWIDTGKSLVVIVMGGQEGNPAVKGWLQALARVIVSHV